MSMYDGLANAYNDVAGNDMYQGLATDGSALRSSDLTAFKPGSITGASMGSMDGTDYGNIYNQQGGVGESLVGGDIMGSISSMLPTLGGLAQLYMQWDSLQAKKDAARDSHNASATQYNNQVVRAGRLGNSVFGPDYKSTQSKVAKSTV